MKNVSKAQLIIFGITLISTGALAQQKIDFGKQEYEAKCASCHGVSGRGDGPLAGLLKKSPSDLTQLAKKNGGVLPTGRLFDVIEGNNVPSHGTRDMPVWGREFRIEDAQYLKEARGNYDPTALVRARILMLLEYIDRLQAR